MAEKRTLARPYAKALYEVARHHNTEDYWEKVLSLLVNIVKDLQTQLLLRDKSLPFQKVAQFFIEIAGSALNDKAQNLIFLLAKRRRLHILPEILSLYHENRNDAENIIEVEFRAPIELDTRQREAYKKILETHFSRTVKMHCKIDDTLMGGFLARAGNFVIDNTVRGTLTELKEAIGE